VIAFASAALLAVGFGAQGMRLVVATLIGFFPLTLLVASGIRRLDPPTLLLDDPDAPVNERRSARSGPECAACSTRLAWARVRLYTSIQCPHCSSNLMVSRSYRHGVTYASLAVAGLVAVIVRVRWAIPLPLVALAFFPAAILITLIAAFLLPPRLIAGE
jgi:DNA-directed RNA polymerase subunit RPC12/RpoP